MQKEKIALVTGGGRGIGRETALELARKGCSVAAGQKKLPGRQLLRSKPSDEEHLPLRPMYHRQLR